MIDVNPNQLETVTRILAGHVPDCEVRAFGSRVTWTAKDYSDLDLVVVGERALDLDALSRLKEAFEESDLPFRVDVLDWHTIGSAFQKVIEKKYEVVQKKKKKSLGIASEWRMCTVDQIKADDDRAIAIGPFGSRMKADRYAADGVPVIRGNNISDTRALVGDLVFVSEETADELRSCNVFAGDLVFPHRGAIGEVGIVPSDEMGRYMLSTSLMKLTCNRELVDPLFIFYFFRSQQGRHALLQNASTVGTPGIGQPLASLRSISVPVPPLLEQRAIAHILGTLDDKIELNRRMNETLEAMARAVFKSWFVNFDPVRAKAEARDPGLPKPVADLFPDSFEDSELGEIPQGWGVTRLDDFAILNPESWSKVSRPATIQYVDLSNTKWGHIESVTTYARDDAPSRAQRVLRVGDTIVGTVRPANGAYALVADRGLTGSTGFAVLRPQRPEYLEFVYLAATIEENIEVLAQLADGGAYPSVRPEVVASSHVVRAPNAVVTAFSNAVSTPLSRMAASERESRALATLRDTLLLKLITGELRVKVIDSIIREPII